MFMQHTLFSQLGGKDCKYCILVVSWKSEVISLCLTDCTDSIFSKSFSTLALNITIKEFIYLFIYFNVFLLSFSAPHSNAYVSIQIGCESLFQFVAWIAPEAEGPQHRQVFAGPLLPAVMAGAFLLPALSLRDGIPVVWAGSCYAALLLRTEMSSPLMFCLFCSLLTLLYSSLTLCSLYSSLCCCSSLICLTHLCACTCTDRNMQPKHVDDVSQNI